MFRKDNYFNDLFLSILFPKLTTITMRSVLFNPVFFGIIPGDSCALRPRTKPQFTCPRLLSTSDLEKGLRAHKENKRDMKIA